MNKAFVRENEDEDDDELSREPAAIAPGGTYMTRKGYEALRKELDALVRVERPQLVEVVAWAASNGDRSENGDYIYGKKRLREIDRRIRFLIKRVESATVVDPADQGHLEQVFFGATVTICESGGANQQRFQIVGVDEADAAAGKVSWISPIARALLKSREGDLVRFESPAGTREIEVLAIEYL